MTNIEQPIDINAKASLESKESRSILVGYRYAVDTVIFLTALKNSGKDKKRVCSRRGRRLTQISLQLNYMSYADVYLFNRRFFQFRQQFLQLFLFRVRPARLRWRLNYKASKLEMMHVNFSLDAKLMFPFSLPSRRSFEKWPAQFYVHEIRRTLKSHKSRFSCKPSRQYGAKIVIASAIQTNVQQRGIALPQEQITDASKQINPMPATAEPCQVTHSVTNRIHLVTNSCEVKHPVSGSGGLI